MKPVIQLDPTGCGIASVAALAGVSYARAKSAPRALCIDVGDPKLWSETRHVRALLRRQGDDRNWATCTEANAAGTGPKDGAKSINEEMVRSGWAVADRRTSNAYLNAQIAADNENVGLWQGTFTAPREWRRWRALPRRRGRQY